MPEVEPTGQQRPPEVAEKPLPAPLQKHSLDGCTVDLRPSNCRRRCSVSLRHAIAAVDVQSAGTGVVALV